MSYDVQAVRRQFPALAQTVHGRPLVYLDNAATAQMPTAVLDAVQAIESRRGNVHRGIHALSEACTAAYESARAEVAAFLGGQPEQVAFTSGTTDAVNRVADSLRASLSPGDAVLVTRMEHHSNLVPWQQLCLSCGAELRIAPLTAEGELDWSALEALLTPNVRLVAAAHASNVLGTVNDVTQLAALAHGVGAALFVDGAQGACHLPVDVAAMDCDYYAFSGHKLGAPFGIGALYSKKPAPPVRFGGGMVETVWDANTTFAPPPLAWEAGTPNVSGAVGLAEAIRFHQALPEGWQAWEVMLLHRLESGLANLNIQPLGQPQKRVGCVSFAVSGVSPFDAAVLLDQLGIAVRSGHHCAQPLLRSLGLDYALRVSPAFYNTPEEIDAFLSGLERVLQICQQ